MLESRLKRMDSKIDKRFNKVKSFFGMLWNAISCSTSTSVQAQDPGKRPAAPVFTWTSSDEGESSRGNNDEEEEEEDEDDDDDDDDDDEEEIRSASS